MRRTGVGGLMPSSQPSVLFLPFPKQALYIKTAKDASAGTREPPSGSPAKTNTTTCTQGMPNSRKALQSTQVL